MSDSDPAPVKRCPRCGETKPLEAFDRNKARKDGRDWRCKACVAAYRRANAEAKRAYNQRYYAANRERMDEQSRLYRITNRESLREYLRQYRSKHSNRLREQAQLYRAEHGDKIRERERRSHAANRGIRNLASRRYYAQHREVLQERQRRRNAINRDVKKEYNRRYRQTHREVFRAGGHRYRARKKANGGNVTPQELAAKRAASNGVCAYCQMQHTPETLTIDHVIPIDQGGPHIIENIAFCCSICNSSKKNRTPEQWKNRWYERKRK